MTWGTDPTTRSSLRAARWPPTTRYGRMARSRLLGNTYQPIGALQVEIGFAQRDWRLHGADRPTSTSPKLTGVSRANLINLLVRALYRSDRTGSAPHPNL